MADFPDRDLQITILAYMGADPTAAPSSWPDPVDLSSRLLDVPIRITTCRQGGQSTAAAGQCTLTLSNVDGHLTPLHPASPYYDQWDIGTPVALDVEGHGRFRGYAAEIRPHIVPGRGGNWSTVTVTLGGILRQRTQGAVAMSPLKHSILGLSNPSEAPVDYWPMEDGPRASSFLSALPGGPALTVTDAELASVDDLPGSGPLALFSGTTELRATLTPGLPVTTVTYTAWAVAWMAKFEVLPGSATTLMEIHTPGGPAERWQARLNGSTIAVRALAADGSTVYSASGGLAPVPTGEWLTFFMLAITTTGPDLFSLEVTTSDGTLLDLAQQSGISGVGTPHELVVPASSALAGMSMGHLFTSAAALTPGYLTSSPNALSAYAGEQAHVRFARICDEAGIPNVTTASESRAMGPQPVATDIDILRDLEAVDHGILYELITDWGFGYRAASQRYNVDLSMTIDLATYRVTEGESGDVLTPVRNDARMRNEWTVSRRDGSTTTYKDETHQAKRGRFDDSATVNVATDEEVLHEAAWRVREGTVGGLRYATLPMDLAANNGGADGSDDLISDWLALQLGDRVIRINHPTTEHPPDAVVDLGLEGYTEALTRRSWLASLNCEPYDPWRVQQLTESPPNDSILDGWLIPDTCTLASDVDEDDTTWSVNIDPLMTTDPDDFPCVIDVAGERILVLSCSGGSSPQTWSVVRAINGIHKAHSAGDPIELLDPLVLSL